MHYGHKQQEFVYYWIILELKILFWYLDLFTLWNACCVWKRTCCQRIYPFSTICVLTWQFNIFFCMWTFQGITTQASVRMQVIPTTWLNWFNPEEVNLLLSGGETNGFDPEALAQHTEYKGGYSAKSDTVKTFWKAVKKMSAEDRKALLKFVTSSSRAPLGGFEFLSPKFTIHMVSKKTRPCICYHLQLNPYLYLSDFHVIQSVMAFSIGSFFAIIVRQLCQLTSYLSTRFGYAQTISHEFINHKDHALLSNNTAAIAMNLEHQIHWTGIWRVMDCDPSQVHKFIMPRSERLFYSFLQICKCSRHRRRPCLLSIVYYMWVG